MTYTELIQAVQAYTENIFPDTYLADNSVYSYTQQLNTFITQAEERIYNTVLIPALRRNVTGTLTAGNKYLSCPTDFLSALSLAVIDDSGNYEYLLDKDVNFMRAAYPNPNDSGLPQYYALFGPTVSSGVTLKELSFIVAPTPDDNYGVELHYYYYPESIVQGAITAIGTVTGGTNYPPGTYYAKSLTGGSGSGALADITVSSTGAVTNVTITNPGCLYKVGDLLSADFSSGASFSFPVASINNAAGTTWLSENYSPVLLYGTLVEAYTFMKGETDMLQVYQQKYQEAIGQLIRLGGALERGDTYRDGQFKTKAAP